MERVDEFKNILYVFIAQKYDSWNKQMCSLDVISIKCTTVKFWESLLDEKSKITKCNQSRNPKKKIQIWVHGKHGLPNSQNSSLIQSIKTV